MTAPSDPPARENTSEPTSASEPTSTPSEARTRIIRRAPTGPLPPIADTATTQMPTRASALPPTTRVPQLPPLPSVLHDEPRAATAVAACAVGIVSGWSTSVVATDLIAGWWRSDRLFCVAVGFLALVFAIATISGVIALLLHRPIGRYLIVAGAVVALLTYGGVFIAGARVAWLVYLLPVLPIASVALALHPQTNRWVSQES
ncbi:hypothetical protein [Mycobacterium kubicae]|uniref:Uncharacterized protein n=1 Tax=Mycobacterium kubicae TaxID=120959 RepID=A0AAX1J6A8_9MYCO|nr:hypothetical protein [Mycobacterium kubicae]MCV7098542.1 hypothetical protein [Mycobacterium kubicae]QPI37014.1 hypothetical protein I2456_21720 [Mycobacterium kubicae]